jgi:membrane complex biogenesis BtpA family protein
MDAIQELFGTRRALIGMLHVGALPGTPAAASTVGALVDRAVSEARLYEETGFHGVIIENMHDRPYTKSVVGAEVVATMTRVASEVRRAVRLPLGVQILAAANREAVAVALACGGCFVRVEGFVFAHVADEGLIDGCAGDLLRYRRAIGAQAIRVFADVKKKHASHAITADIEIAATARAAEFFLADAVVITGEATGHEADPRHVEAASRAVRIPVIVGSGLTPDTVAGYPTAQGFVVGSAVKRHGVWWEDVDRDRAARMAEAFQRGHEASQERPDA